MKPYFIGNLSETVRRENNWLTRNYHGIEWKMTMKMLILNTLRYICETLRYIYSRGQEKVSDLIYSPETYIIWKVFLRLSKIYRISKAEDNVIHITDFDLTSSQESYCALHNAYKLKHWLTIRNSNNLNYDSLPSENWSESGKTEQKFFNSI